MPELDFRAPRLFVDAPLREGERIALERNQSNYLGNVLRLGSGENILVFNGRDGEWRAQIDGPQAARRPDHRRPDAAAGPPARHRLCLCAAETRPPRLHGAEGGRDGGLQAAAGVDPSHPGLAGQRRADARQCHRGRRAMRHPQPRRCRRARGARPLSRRARTDAPAGVLRRGDRDRAIRCRRCNRG